MSDIQSTVKTVGGALVAIVVVALVLATMFGVVPQLLGDDAVFETGADGFESGELVSGNDEAAGIEVALTTETGAVMGANESYVDDPTPPETWGDPWTVAITAELHEESNSQATYVVYGADNETVLMLYEDGEWTARYDDGSMSAYVAGDAEIGEQTPLVAAWDGTELSLYVDGELVDNSTLTSDTVSRDAAISWYGTLDEVQILTANVGAAGAEQYADAPTAPLQPADAAARLQFDEGRATTVYYADGDAELVGDVAVGPGVSDPALARGTDYEVSLSPVTVEALDGGHLKDAPIVYVTWSDGAFAGVVHTVRDVGGSALGLLIVALLVLSATALLRQFGDGGFSR